MKYFVIALIALPWVAGCQDRPKKLLGRDYRIFEHTNVWDMAQAVRDNDTSELARIARNRQKDLNFQEPIFGETLLLCAILNGQYQMGKRLLELGADPNVHNRQGESAIIMVASYSVLKHDTTFIKILLAHGANPNDRERGDAPIATLTRAAGESLEKVKVLVNAGANVNEPDSNIVSPLTMALVRKRYDIALYLMSKGAEYGGVVINRRYSGHGDRLHILDMLREDALPLDSDEYQHKMKVVKFLLDHGIDYRKSPIPPIAIKQAKKMYPNSWQDYLEKY